MIRNEKNELIHTRTVSGWRVCIDYRKLNTTTRKDHYPLPFIDQMLDRLAGHPHYCFLNGYSHLHVLMTLFLLEGCHLDYVMLLPPSKGIHVYVFRFSGRGNGNLHG